MSTRPLDPWEQAYSDFETPAQEVAKFESRLRTLGADRLVSTSEILEICCGRGNALVAWQRLGYSRTVGLDWSVPLLQAYRGDAPRVAGDIRRMPIVDDAFDVVAVHGGLHHLPSLDDLDATLREVARVVRHDGRIIIVEPWSTPFLTVVHAVSRQMLARRLSKRVDAFERMYELERTTYDAWLARPDAILSIVRRYVEPICLKRGWGKLMLLGRPVTRR
ncbi:MAG TPA: class I SAM-dependent methyltransferase [Vicinamibacterales bacterium]|nr:class I SAM-dependent methyltransferase [Vicinamibacterales bacterium]